MMVRVGSARISSLGISRSQVMMSRLAARARSKSAGFQADDVGDIHLGQQTAPACEIAGTEDLEIMRRGVAGKGQVLLVLADDFMANRRRQAVTAEAADGEVIAVVQESSDGVVD